MRSQSKMPCILPALRNDRLFITHGLWDPLDLDLRKLCLFLAAGYLARSPRGGGRELQWIFLLMTSDSCVPLFALVKVMVKLSFGFVSA